MVRVHPCVCVGGGAGWRGGVILLIIVCALCSSTCEEWLCLHSCVWLVLCWAVGNPSLLRPLQRRSRRQEMTVGWSPSLHGRLTSSEKNCPAYKVKPLYRGHIGTPLGILNREVSLIQRWICIQLYVVGTADSVLIREVLYSECPL